LPDVASTPGGVPAGGGPAGGVPVAVDPAHADQAALHRPVAEAVHEATSPAETTSQPATTPHPSPSLAATSLAATQPSPQPSASSQPATAASAERPSPPEPAASAQLGRIKLVQRVTTSRRVGPAPETAPAAPVDDDSSGDWQSVSNPELKSGPWAALSAPRPTREARPPRRAHATTRSSSGAIVPVPDAEAQPAVTVE